jgi:hypothetical protein
MLLTYLFGVAMAAEHDHLWDLAVPRGTHEVVLSSRWTPDVAGTHVVDLRAVGLVPAAAPEKPPFRVVFTGEELTQGGEVRWYKVDHAPTRWDEPPPMWPGDWPEALIAVEDGWVAYHYDALWHIRDAGEPVRVFDGGTGLSYPANGPLAEAAVEWLSRPFWLDGHLLAWDKGGQQLLELVPDPERWEVRTVWSRPTVDPPQPLFEALNRDPGQYWLWHFRAELDAGPARADPARLRKYIGDGWHWYGARVLAQTALGEPAQRPEVRRAGTVAEVVADWARPDWIEGDLNDFTRANLEGLRLLEAHRTEALAALTPLDSPEAVLARAYLRDEALRPVVETMVLTPVERGWESGCSYPRTEVGIEALEHLTRLPLKEALPRSEAQLAAMRELVKEADLVEGMDRWCGPGGHARVLLALYE